MNNNVRIGAVYGPTIASGYQLIGGADFNGDTKPDYSLYNTSTRKGAIWYLNNNYLHQRRVRTNSPQWLELDRTMSDGLGVLV